MDDPRFAKFSSDPKFRPVPRRERKIKIDPRFKSMFNDKSFVDKVSVDKRGRPKNFATKENFEKFYDLVSCIAGIVTLKLLIHAHFLMDRNPVLKMNRMRKMKSKLKKRSLKRNCQKLRKKKLSKAN